MDRSKLGGVCAGIARYCDVDVTLMRILWVIAIFFSGGLAIPLYVVAWIVMPRDWPYPPPPTRRIVVC
jgi:phage shock protein PspC (stress-responsive transcriptional regulator)